MIPTKMAESPMGFWHNFFKFYNWYTPCKLTAWHLKIDPCKKEIPIGNHQFSGAKMLVSGRVDPF